MREELGELEGARASTAYKHGSGHSRLQGWPRGGATEAAGGLWAPVHMNVWQLRVLAREPDVLVHVVTMEGKRAALHHGDERLVRGEADDELARGRGAELGDAAGDVRGAICAEAAGSGGAHAGRGAGEQLGGIGSRACKARRTRPASSMRRPDANCSSALKSGRLDSDVCHWEKRITSHLQIHLKNHINTKSI